MSPGRSDPISVVKVGGGLTALPHALDHVCRAVSEASRMHRLLVVPGGGPFADAVRRFQHSIPLSDETAHWMAILAMDQYGLVLAERIPGAVLLEEPGTVAQMIVPGRPGVLAPSRWMRSADVLPHNWEVTSDSVAAFVAGALDADQLVLIKPAEVSVSVDRYFGSALPTGLSYRIMAWEDAGRLAATLSGQNAGGAWG